MTETAIESEIPDRSLLPLHCREGSGMVPKDLKYSEEHEWVQVEGDLATVGITDYAQTELGDIVFVELPNVGDTLIQTEPFGTVEAVKAVSEIFAPISGEVVEVNEALDDTPQLMNQDPYGDGWLLKVRMSDQSELEHLLTPKDYQDLIGD
jgi:glycine cleavage system H protein